jgi:hypothetical protein
MCEMCGTIQVLVRNKKDMDLSNLMGSVAGAAEQAGAGALGGALGDIKDKVAGVASVAGVDPETVQKLVVSGKELLGSGTALAEVKTKLEAFAATLGIPAAAVDAVIAMVMGQLEGTQTPAQQ